MPPMTLKSCIYKQLEVPITYKKIRHLRGCPYSLAEPILRLMTHNQLLLLEENTPNLELYTQGLWKLHTLKQFPNIGETHEIDGEAAADADWRATFEDMQQDRRDRELAAREKLKANYGKIADGKSERSIQVIKKTAPSGAGSRARAAGSTTARSALGLKTTGRSSGASIMSKALKGAMSSSTRKITPVPLKSMNSSTLPPDRSTREADPVVKKLLPQACTGARPSKFLTTTRRH